MSQNSKCNSKISFLNFPINTFYEVYDHVNFILVPKYAIMLLITMFLRTFLKNKFVLFCKVIFEIKSSNS